MADVYAPRDAEARPAWLWIAVAGICATGLVACMTTLYLGAQFVMGEGGFVAIGGPYEIAHPAPEWIIIVPGSILLGTAFVLTHTVASVRAGGFHILGMMWVGLFGVLGWGFLRSGFNPPGGGLSWAWIFCGVVFWMMALPVLVAVVASFRSGGPGLPFGASFVPGRAQTGGPPYVIVHLLAVPAGIALGLWVWQMVTGL